MLSAAAALVAVAGALWTLLKIGRRLWAATAGARRSQTRSINRLFPEANIEHIEAILGPATLISRRDSTGSVRRYRLLDCWLSIGEVEGAAEWISITVTDRKFVFRTRRFTGGLIDVRLGRDCFDVVGTFFRPGDSVVGNKEQRYVEVCDGPTAHRSQKALLANTNLGVGKLEVMDALSVRPTFVREKTTINSIAIAKPFGDIPDRALLGTQETWHVPLGRRRPLTRHVRSLRIKISIARFRRRQRRQPD